MKLKFWLCQVDEQFTAAGIMSLGVVWKMKKGMEWRSNFNNGKPLQEAAATIQILNVKWLMAHM